MRAMGHSHPAPRCPGGLHTEVQVIYAAVKLASKLLYLPLNLYLLTWASLPGFKLLCH